MLKNDCEVRAAKTGAGGILKIWCSLKPYTANFLRQRWGEAPFERKTMSQGQSALQGSQQLQEQHQWQQQQHQLYMWQHQANLWMQSQSRATPWQWAEAPAPLPPQQGFHQPVAGGGSDSRVSTFAPKKSVIARARGLPPPRQKSSARNPQCQMMMSLVAKATAMREV